MSIRSTERDKIKKPIVIEHDYHGLTVEQAMSSAEKVINLIYQNPDGRYIVKFITGRGKIQKALIAHLKSLGVEAIIPMYNTGVIVFNA